MLRSNEQWLYVGGGFMIGLGVHGVEVWRVNNSNHYYKSMTRFCSYGEYGWHMIFFDSH